jgi:hypothetical protein
VRVVLACNHYSEGALLLYKRNTVQEESRRWSFVPSTLLISPAPKPVKVRLCLGLEKPGPTGPWSSEIGALVEGRRSLGAAAMVDELGV